ncbi:ubiquinol-cytochrome C reductase [Gonapodya prolifera JEL478]|uniref:Complex III subunit 9 n=1 Tax=Gonapodya prolifera (strain JEL478) TaxID=1344416 RepID=A0A139A797_GONPJ|nr:ubiquinol-cytochrome C reductase [Gonapodya prolifera JEL478]|eukprot:KXS12661.1 ubiquinol-cytochrome C reductase [Gonapodya prolifera JEL478]
MSLARNLYNAVLRRNTTFFGLVFASAFALEIVFDESSNAIWDRINAGRQWKDIRGRYIQE